MPTDAELAEKCAKWPNGMYSQCDYEVSRNGQHMGNIMIDVDNSERCWTATGKYKNPHNPFTYDFHCTESSWTGNWGYGVTCNDPPISHTDQNSSGWGGSDPFKAALREAKYNRGWNTYDGAKWTFATNPTDGYPRRFNVCTKQEL
eukprot:TRINITY_DN96678_c0_g1_i1.p1 TRINITY_DN96678_c0_g1~~TRINITY_DN96678_c0_g1_i1.p1  ORF type:complete len:146 (+),score=12.43 TRINITY_DN96678_c0_g1_i1:83-520(+)